MAQKVYARDNTLYKIAKDQGWGFIQTNEYGSSSKAHLLEMRRGSLDYVKYGQWNNKQVRQYIQASYSDKLAYWYCLSFKGSVRLLEMFPNSNFDEMKSALFNKIFYNPDKDFINFRL